MRKIVNLILILFVVAGTVLPFFALAQDSSDMIYYPDTNVPYINPRTTWDNSPSLNSLLTWYPKKDTMPPDYNPVERFVVHYTATPNHDPYSAISRIQSIYRFHAVTNGWGDIGYNYLIDQNGKIYEGRYGGNAVRGAHAYDSSTGNNYNVGSIGISLIGTFLEEDASPAMYDSLSRLIGWLGALNNVDPGENNKMSTIWNFNTSSYSASYTGPAVIGHENVDSGKIDPGLVDLSKVSKNAHNYYLQYKNYIYKTASSDKIYVFSKGEPIEYANLEEYKNKADNSSPTIVILNQSQLDLFPKDKFQKYPDNTLISTTASTTVYMISKGTKRPMAMTGKQFISMGFKFDQVRKVPSGDLTLYQNGIDIKYAPDNQLIRDVDDKVYQTTSGRKRWIPSITLFNLLKLKVSKIKDAPNDAITYLNGDPVNYPENTLVRGQQSGIVYLMQLGQKRTYISENVLIAQKKNIKKAIIIPDEELSYYQTGTFIGYPENTLAKSANNNTVYLLKNNQKQAFQTADIFINLKYKWSNIKILTDNELAYYPEGLAINYPDGTYVQKKGDPTIYLVKNSNAEALDEKTVKAKKVKLSKVLKLSLADFAIHFLGKTSEIEEPITKPDPIPTSQIATTSTTETPINPNINIPGKIKIAIYSVPENQKIKITADGNYNYCADQASSTNCILKTKGDIVEVDYGINTFARFTAISTTTIMELQSYNDKPSWLPSINYNRFRDTLEINYSSISKKLWVINELNLENYLRGIGEALNNDQIEYQKAFSIITRSYALFHLQNGGKYGPDEIFHLKNGSTDQVYKGYTFETIAPNLVSAVENTAGKVITYKSKVARALYSSDSGGTTKDACAVFGGYFCNIEYDYLRGGVKDPAETVHVQSKIDASHGVGMSAIGARKMAEQGKKYDEILKYYYLGINIE